MQAFEEAARVEAEHRAEARPTRSPLLWDATESADLFRRVVLLAKGHFWFLPAIIALAVVAALFEGASLTLVIPLIQLLDGGSLPLTDGGVMTLVRQTIEMLPVQSKLVAIVVAIIAAVSIKSIVSYANMALFGVVYGRVSHELRTRVFTRIIDTPLADFESDRSGRQLNILSNETWRATDALKYLFTIIVSAATILVFSVILLFLSWRLTLIALACIAVLVPLVHLIGIRAKGLGAEGLSEYELMTKHTWTALNGMRMIHAFGCENSEIERFGRTSDRVRHLLLKTALYTMVTTPITDVAVTAVIAMLLLFVQADGLGLGAFAGFLAVLYRMQPRVLSLAGAHTSLLALHSSVVAVSQVLGAREIRAAGSGKPFHGLRGGLSFENVTFRYRGAAHPALMDVSFDIPRGSMVAIVGASGAGKSTLIDLLLQFQKPQQGRVLVDGLALSELDLASWRARLGVVNQDAYIFDDTVTANLAYGSPNASGSEILDASRVACADEFIRGLPKGYDTIVGERGTQLSAGQRQRIALARAILRHPDLLILDEATNALDTTTERAFQHALATESGKRTVIIVAHRLTTIENVDHIVVLDGGRVVEQGPPAALLGAGRSFARLFGTGNGLGPERSLPAASHP